MPSPAHTLELAVRLRRDAEATNMLEYAELLRRAAEELEDFVLAGARAVPQQEPLAS